MLWGRRFPASPGWSDAGLAERPWPETSHERSYRQIGEDATLEAHGPFSRGGNTYRATQV